MGKSKGMSGVGGGEDNLFSVGVSLTRDGRVVVEEGSAVVAGKGAVAVYDGEGNFNPEVYAYLKMTADQLKRQVEQADLVASLAGGIYEQLRAMMEEAFGSLSPSRS